MGRESRTLDSTGPRQDINGQQTITASAAGSVSFASTVTGAQTVAGTASNVIPTLTRSDLWQRSAIVTMTIASPSVISGAGHIYGAGVPIRFSTTGSLPTGFTAGTTYFVVNPVAGVSYQLALTIGGAAINTSGTQTGVHTAVGGIGVAGTLVSGSPSRSAANVQSRVNGMLVNTNAIPNGPGALAGLYLGTVRTNGAAATVSTAQAT